MKEISTTITCGIGSEKHNHDLEYRASLTHVHGRENGVIEVIPYRSYEEQINEMMKPFIDQFNERQKERYQAAWERYKSGEIKTKPRKSNYKPMTFNYYQEHKDDTYHSRKTGKEEKLPIFRSLILGLGDRSDREKGIISEKEAVDVLSGVVAKWPTLYPDFKLLGATIHLDEEGFYHAHIDYKPLYETHSDQGLQCGIGQESALERMKFEPEQSIINGRDKAPIRFNAFRNALYRMVESELARHSIRLQYGVSKIKEPAKDSSKNQKMENWRASQDAARDLQHTKNVALDVLAKDEVSSEDLSKAITSAGKIIETLEQIEDSPRARLTKDKSYAVSFRLFDQLKSFIKQLMESIGTLLKQVDLLRSRSDLLNKENSELKNSNAVLLRKLEELERSPATDFLQENLRKNIFRSYDKLLEEYPAHQPLIFDRVNKAIKEAERELSPENVQKLHQARDELFEKIK